MNVITDPVISIEGKGRVRVSEITATPASRIHWLNKHHGNAGNVLCLCRPDGIPMGVGQRTIPHETYYLYPLHRSDPLRHALGCPHRPAPIKSGGRASENARPEVEIYGGYVNVDLAHPLSRILRSPKDSTAIKETAVSILQPSTATSKPAPTAKLALLAELLWSQSALNHWHPGFQGRRSYNVVRKRLLESAKSIAVRRQPLAKTLYIPPPYYENRKEEINTELQRWAGALKQRGSRQPYGFLAGFLKQVTADRGGHSLRLANFPRRVVLDANAYQKIDEIIGNNPVNDAEAPIFLFSIVELDQQKAYLKAVETCVLHLTHEYLPVTSEPEAILLIDLVEKNRQFRRPLKAEYVDCPPEMPIPSVILEDTADRICLEIFPNIDDAKNIDRLEKLKNAYVREEQSVIFWDPKKELMPGNLPQPHIETKHRGLDNK